MASTVVGTMAYWPPERFNLEDRYDSRSDVWSFGITLIEVLYGQVPYRTSDGVVPVDYLRLHHLIMHVDPEMMIKSCLKAYGKIEHEENFIRLCLKSVSERPKFKDLTKSDLYKIFDIKRDYMCQTVANVVEQYQEVSNNRNCLRSLLLLRYRLILQLKRNLKNTK